LEGLPHPRFIIDHQEQRLAEVRLFFSAMQSGTPFS
jgi:hypothetical protein